MAKEFLPLENSSNQFNSDNLREQKREQIKHLLVGSPKVVQRTIHILHLLKYSEVKEWSSLQNAGSLGEPGDVVSVLIRNIVAE